MIYSDGAGACIIEGNTNSGEILGHASQTHANGEAYYLYFDRTFDQDSCVDTRYIKMDGRKIYEFACTHVPQAMADCLDKSEIGINQVKKIFIHQANEKMDQAIIKRFYRIYGKEAPETVMPMIIKEMGNNSVATVPILYDRIRRGKVKSHDVKKGDVVLFASVGAGMNINTIVYKV